MQSFVVMNQIPPVGSSIWDCYHVLFVSLLAYTKMSADLPDIGLVVLIASQQKQNFQLLWQTSARLVIFMALLPCFLLNYLLFFVNFSLFFDFILRIFSYLRGLLSFGAEREVFRDIFELLFELMFEFFDLLNKIVAGCLDGVISEAIVWDSDEDLFEILNEIWEGLIFVFEFFDFLLDHWECQGVLVDKAKIIDPELGY